VGRYPLATDGVEEAKGGEEAPEASRLQVQQCVHAVAAEGNQDGPVCDGRNGLTLAINHQKFAVEQE
jgi:hypothetical protein